MAAHLLLRDPSLVTAKDSEQVANFYDPRTRKLDPDDDPVFESKSEAARQAWAKSLEDIQVFFRLKHRWPQWEEWKDGEREPYFDEKEQFGLFVALMQWQAELVAELHLKVDGIDEVFNEDGEVRNRPATSEELESQSSQVGIARDSAEELWMRWRDKLSLYIQRIRLAYLIVQRRNETKLSQEQFARVAQVSASTIKNFENVDEPDRWFSPKTLRLMEAALGWTEGSIPTILRGGDPGVLQDWNPAVIGNQVPNGVAGATGAVTGGTQSTGAAQGQVAIRLDADSLELLRRIALQEDRTINAVVVDAIAFYAKYHLNKEPS